MDDAEYQLSLSKEARTPEDDAKDLDEALKVIINLYTDQSHFIYELLQNAEDAQASNVKFVLTREALTVLHDGIPFTRDDFSSICKIGQSTKLIVDKDKPNPIGKFGLGFKSVYGICKEAKIFSNLKGAQFDSDKYPRYSQVIKNYLHPSPTEQEEIGDGFTTKFVFPLAFGEEDPLRYKTLDELLQQLSDRISNLRADTFLFLKHIKAVTYEILISESRKTGGYALKKKFLDGSDHCYIVTAIGKNFVGEEATQYLVYSKEFIPGERKGTLDIAFCFNVNEKNQFVFQKPSFPYISVYFPTQTETKLNFLVQGPFQTNKNREAVILTGENEQLFDRVASLFKKFVLEMRDRKLLNYSLLNLFPFSDGGGTGHALSAAVYKKAKEVLENETIYPFGDVIIDYVDAKHARIVRGADNVNVFPDALLSELFGEELHWLPTFLTAENKEFATLHNALIDSGVHYDYQQRFYVNFVPLISELQFADLLRAINENPTFLPNRNENWLVEFYELCCGRENVFKANKWAMESSIVKCEDGSFQPAYINGVRNVFAPSESCVGKDLHYVAANLYREKSSFFKFVLNIKPIKDFDKFAKSIKDKYEEKNIAASLEDIKSALNYLLDEDSKNECLELISSYFKFQCKSEDNVSIALKDSIVFPIGPDGINLADYYYGIKNYLFLDLMTYESLGTMALSQLKDIIPTANFVLGTWWGSKIRFYIKEAKGTRDAETVGDFEYNLTLEALPQVLRYISKNPHSENARKKSRIILSFITRNENRLFGSVLVTRKGPFEGQYTAKSELIRIINNESNDYREADKPPHKWLYRKDGALVSANEIDYSQLDGELYQGIQLSEATCEKLGFKKTRKERIDGLSKAILEMSWEDQRATILSLYEQDPTLFDEMPRTTTTVSTFESSIVSTSDVTFPSAPVRNWEALSRFIRQMLYFAEPTKYEIRPRSIRISATSKEVKDHLLSFYQKSHSSLCACQICHQDTQYIESCAIEKQPELELTPMNLAVCHECHREYESIRNNSETIASFLNVLVNLDDETIKDNDPVKIKLQNLDIWFAQTHIAEIRELLRLMEDKEKA